MIAFLLMATVVAVAGWYVGFVVLPATPETLPPSRRAPTSSRPATGNANTLDTYPAQAWTALDDHQLARLLNDSST